MKKIFYLASIAALALSSCAKDETTEAQINSVNGGAKITAAMSADETRTSLEKVDGKYEFRWSAGDQLGVYGVGGGLNNAAFVLNNDSDGKAVGVFASQSTELKADKKYVAVYPRFQTSLFNTTISEVELPVLGTTSKAKIADLTGVTMSIPATQKYQPETFYTQTVPSVSTTFVVDENGAQVSMQPVVDYLFVNIKSTEPISKLYLELVKSNGSEKYNIAGKGQLARYELGNDYRYMLNVIDEDESDIIVLEMDESSDAVTCHDANTYVFTVPAGILGMNDDVQACIFVNEYKSSPDFYVANGNAQLNFFWDTKGTASTADDVKVSRRHATTAGKYISRLENTVFWANPMVDTDGDNKVDARGSFVYNPNGDVIIKNEVELLRYINQYNLQNTNLDEDDYDAPAGMEADEDVQYYGKDAFLCEDGSYDFSLKNMMELATEYKNTEFEPYIAAYLADVAKGGGFPCFVEYENNFIGNGAVIENIEQPLLSWSGIFGGEDYTDYKVTDIIPVTTRGGEFVETKNGEASITNVTFANIVAKSDVEVSNAYIDSMGAKIEFTRRGHVLAGTFDGTIKNVTVKNADGESIMGDMSVAQYNGLTIEGVSKLDNIATYLNAEASLDLTKTWDEVSGVKENVFAYIYPEVNAKNEDALHVITIAEGDADEYAKLTWMVNPYTDSAVAVVIDGVSYWTGDSFAPSKAIKNAAGAVVGYQARYAEELAGAHEMAIELTRDFDLNYSNLQWDFNGDGYADRDIKWSMIPLQSLNGAKNSISNVVMSAAYVEALDNDDKPIYAMQWGIAPFMTPVVKDITLNNVYINVATPDVEVRDENGLYVPQYIAGLTLGSYGEDRNGNLIQTVISDATVNGLVIDAYRQDNTNNTEANYSDSYVSLIGWAVAHAQDAQITNVKVNGVQSTAKGIAGLVAKNLIQDSSKFVKAEVANVEAVNAAITKFAQYNPARKNYNVMGTAVGLVENGTNRMVDIKFMQCGEPVFLYDAYSTLTVIYNETEKGSFKNK